MKKFKCEISTMKQTDRRRRVKVFDSSFSATLIHTKLIHCSSVTFIPDSTTN